MLKRDIQKAGVAPTDDSFTVIAPGPVDTGTCVTGCAIEEKQKYAKKEVVT